MFVLGTVFFILPSFIIVFHFCLAVCFHFDNSIVLPFRLRAASCDPERNYCVIHIVHLKADKFIERSLLLKVIGDPGIEFYSQSVFVALRVAGYSSHSA